MTIKTFSIEYDAVNSRNTFTNGDVIKGRIIVETSKETKVQSLIFIAKAKARVRWQESHGRRRHGVGAGRRRIQVYRAEEKYYEVQQHILREARQDGTEVIGQGRHVFPFTFQIPDRKLPPSFEATTGKIVHKVKAELRQSMKLTKKTQAYYTFVPRPDLNNSALLEPQYASKDKSVKTFGSGTLSMDAYTMKLGYYPGETLEVRAEITNNSSRSVKPKFTLYEEKTFLAQGHRKHFSQELLRKKGDDIGTSSGKQTVSQKITIPTGLHPSILDCSIIKLEYRLKIQLDIKYALDPEMKLPVVILAPVTSHAKAPPAAHGFGFEAFGSPAQPTWGASAPPTWGASAPPTWGASAPPTWGASAQPGGFQPTAPPPQYGAQPTAPPPQYGAYPQPLYPPLSSDIL